MRPMGTAVEDQLELVLAGGPAGSSVADTYTRGLRSPDDIVWHIVD